MFDIHKLVKSFKEADKVKQEFRDYLKELGPIFFDNVHDEIPYLDADDLDLEITEDWENIYFSQRRVDYDEDDTFTYTIPIAALESLETFKEWCTGHWWKCPSSYARRVTNEARGNCAIKKE